MKSTVIHRGDHVHIQHAYVCELEDVLGALAAVHKLFTAGAPRRVVSDVRNIVRAWTQPEELRILDALRTHFQGQMRLAILTHDHADPAERRLMATWQVSRGWRVKIFTEEGAALGWIRIGGSR